MDIAWSEQYPGVGESARRPGMNPLHPLVKKDFQVDWRKNRPQPLRASELGRPRHVRAARRLVADVTRGLAHTEPAIDGSAGAAIPRQAGARSTIVGARYW